jgi:putative effector of murein hydrolase
MDAHHGRFDMLDIDRRRRHGCRDALALGVAVERRDLGQLKTAVRTVWHSLESTPSLWLFVTIAAYLFGRALQRRVGGSAIANPVLIAIVLVGAVLLLTGTPYSTYFSGAGSIDFLLGPATVALAIPLAKNLTLIRHSLPRIVIALMAGSIASSLSGLLMVICLGGSRRVALSMAPKAVTTPIAMAVSQQIGGVPALTAALAILGGIVAALTGRYLLRLLNVVDWRAQGLAAGVAGSGIAAAHVASRSHLGATFAALGMGVNGLITALLLPLLVRYF